MRANNTLVQQNTQPKFTTVISGQAMQSLIAKSMPDERSRARFTATMISAVAASQQLQNCTPATVISAALRGEGMGLLYNNGYYVVPYGNTATFVLSFKGFIQLAMATGLYADIDCIDVRQGEKKGRDKRTGKPIIDLSVYETDEEREAQPIIGYYGYFELKDGTFRYEYWSVEKLLAHANRYSAAFKLATYNRMINGQLTDGEMASLAKSSPWYDLGGGQDAMMKKTVLRSLLNSGYAPLSNEVRTIFRNDTDDAPTEDVLIPVEESKEEQPAQDAEIVTETAQEETSAEEVEEVTAEPKKRRGRKPKKQEDALDSFFDEVDE